MTSDQMREKISPLREAINTALVQVSEEFGVTLKIQGSASYTGGGISFKLYAAEEGSSKEAEDFKLYHARYRLSPHDLNKEFMFDGRKVILLGAKPRSRKYPLVVKFTDTQERIRISHLQIKPVAVA